MPIEANCLEGHYVLIAEDSDDLWNVVRIFFGLAGARVERACNGVDAVEKALSKHFDAVLMDVQMPKMDGLEATRTLRESGFEKPIIAFTTNSLSTDAVKSAAAGCNGHINKPQSGSGLISAFMDSLRRANPQKDGR